MIDESTTNIHAGYGETLGNEATLEEQGGSEHAH